MKFDEFINEFNNKAKAKRKTKPIAHGFDNYGKNVPHLFSNQIGFHSVLNRLAEMQSLKIMGKQNVAIILGEGNFLSCLPELSNHVDAIIFIDIDPLVLTHNLYMLECFKNARNPREFGDSFFGSENPILKLKLPVQKYAKASTLQPNQFKYVNNASAILDVPLLQSNFRGQMSFLNQHHFINSLERFNKCKAALQNLTFFSLEADVLDHDLMKEFGEQLIINNASVRIFNITNLFDYEGNYPVRQRPNETIDWQPNDNVTKSLETIIDRPDEATILYSVTAIEHHFDKLIADMAGSLSEYKALTTRYATLINVCHRRPEYTVGKWYDYASQIKMSIRTTGNYGFFSYRPKIDLPWAKDLESFVQYIEGFVILRNSKHKYIDAIIKIKSEHEDYFIQLLQKYQVAYRKCYISIVIVDLENTQQKNKILAMMSNESELATHLSRSKTVGL